MTTVGRRARGVVLAVVVVAAYVAVILTYALGSPTGAPDLREPAPGKALVYLDVDTVSGEKFSLDARVSVYPGEGLTDDDGNNVTIFGYGAVAVVGIGALALGLVLMVIQWLTSPDYFHGLTLPRRSSSDLVLVPATGVEAKFGLPDSGDMPTVIAPDLSNLPPGETAVNPETGEEFTRN